MHPKQLLESGPLKSNGRQLAIWFLLTFLLPLPCSAQLPAVANSRLAVDCVKSEGLRFYGFLLGSQTERITLAVEREWLQKTYPESAAEWDGEEKNRLAEISTKYQKRIDQWIEERSQFPPLVAALKGEKERIASANQPDHIADKKFVILTFDRQAVELVYRQAPSRKQWAALAWHHNLPSVTAEAADRLKQQLQDVSHSLEEAQVTLAAELPSCDLSDSQWKIRQAMYEYVILGEMEFQGMNEWLTPVSPDGQSDLLKHLLQGGNETLQQLLTPQRAKKDGLNDWKSSACKQAEQKGYRSVVIKRTLMGTSGSPAAVEIQFLVKTDDIWTTIATIRESVSLTAPGEQERERLTADPQVQQVLQSMEMLGLDTDSRLVQQALNQGVAVQSALAAADKKLEQLLGRNTLYLDLPFTLP